MSKVPEKIHPLGDTMYTRLLYIQSCGIKTEDLNGRGADYMIPLELSIDPFTDEMEQFSHGVSDYSHMFGCAYKTEYCGWLCCNKYYGVGVQNGGGWKDVLPYQKTPCDLHIKLNKEGATVNGRFFSVPAVAPETEMNQLSLMGTGYWAAAGVYQSHWCRIRRNGELIADFVPVMRKYDGKCGMYDLVRHKFFCAVADDAYFPGPKA